jgi:protein-tyrosine phosphatase
MGGYSAADGRSVRWKTLYRSGTTHAMTSEDIAQLSENGIRYAYDLRSNTERREYPSRLVEIANIQYWFRDHDHISSDIKRLLNSRDLRPEHAHQVMVSFYRRLPYEFEEAFRLLFRYLGQGTVPLVFNCTAGKDRTGVAAALVLTALGVQRETVFEDYLLTSRFFDRSCEMILKDTNAEPFAKVDREIWEPLMSVRSEYLSAMFEQLQGTHGSVERYFDEQLGVDRHAIERFRSNLLD